MTSEEILEVRIQWGVSKHEPFRTNGIGQGNRSNRRAGFLHVRNGSCHRRHRRRSRILDGTRFYAPEVLTRLRDEVLARPAEGLSTTLEVVNETTLAAIARVLSAGHALSRP